MSWGLSVEKWPVTTPPPPPVFKFLRILKFGKEIQVFLGHLVETHTYFKLIRYHTLLCQFSSKNYNEFVTNDLSVFVDGTLSTSS